MNAGPIPMLPAFSNKNAGLQRANRDRPPENGAQTPEISPAHGDPRLGLDRPIIGNLLDSDHQHCNRQETRNRSEPEHQPEIVFAHGHEADRRQRSRYGSDRRERSA